MKKLVKVLVVLLAFFSQLPFAAAQDAAPSFVDLMTQANEAALKLETFHLESSLSVIGTTKTTPRSLTANLTGDVDVKNAELQGSLDLQLPPTTNGQFEAVVKGAKAFFREGDKDWHVSDVSVNKQEFQKAYAKFLEVAKTNSELDKNLIQLFLNYSMWKQKMTSIKFPSNKTLMVLSSIKITKPSSRNYNKRL